MAGLYPDAPSPYPVMCPAVTRTVQKRVVFLANPVPTLSPSLWAGDANSPEALTWHLPGGDWSREGSTCHSAAGRAGHLLPAIRHGSFEVLGEDVYAWHLVARPGLGALEALALFHHTWLGTAMFVLPTEPASRSFCRFRGM